MSSSFDSLVKKLAEDDLERLSQESDDVFHLVNQKRVCPFEYMNDFQRFKLPFKEKFYNYLKGKQISEK